LLRRGLLLEYLTIAWNAAEAALAVAFGLLASSIALIGFGFDSLIEVFAAVVVVWDLRGGSQERERTAPRLIA
jgi:divalent metal cation (Fe/Co/Zn/Cd) transporter